MPAPLPNILLLLNAGREQGRSLRRGFAPILPTKPFTEQPKLFYFPLRPTTSSLRHRKTLHSFINDCFPTHTFISTGS